MKDIVTPKSACPVCRYECDRATCIEDFKVVSVRPGDVSLCINCGAFLQFDASLNLQSLPDSEFRSLGQDQRELMLRASENIKAKGGHSA
jgi:hypothetical protein